MKLRLLPPSQELGAMPYVWLFYLVFPLAEAALRGFGVAGWALTGGSVLVFLVLYFSAFWVQGRALLAIIAGITLIGIANVPFTVGSATYFIYAASFAGLFERRRTAYGLVALIALTPVVECFVLGMPAQYWIWAPVVTALVGVGNVHWTRVEQTRQSLRMAQGEVIHLAKLAERERIARDLHDLLGNTLSVIVLKAELAAKLASLDPERAAQEIRDVERISRNALAEVRRAVGGYRAGGIGEEVERARGALESAGVEADIAASDTKLPPQVEAVLALALREAVTNVIRHARATRCTIRLEAEETVCRLVVADNGKGSRGREGYGLIGMRERLQSLGGSLLREVGAGTRLIAAVPIDLRASAPAPLGVPQEGA
jgi:two-component system sensor histidine kinase DesK